MKRRKMKHRGGLRAPALTPAPQPPPPFTRAALFKALRFKRKLSGPAQRAFEYLHHQDLKRAGVEP